MAFEGKRQIRNRRWRVVAVGVVGWIAVVVIGAGSRSDRTALLGVDNLEVVWVVVLGLSALGGLAQLVWINPFESEWSRPERTRRRGTGFLLICALAVLWWRPDLVNNLTLENRDDLATFGQSTAESEIADEKRPDTVAQATDVLLVVLIGGGLAAVWFIARTKMPDDEEVEAEDSDTEFETDLDHALRHAGLVLANGSDPRVAVLNAYAILEGVLASHGLRRATSETAPEHMQRALACVPLHRSAAVMLSNLYEVARFSDQLVSPDDQQAAAAALSQARSSLESHN